MLKLNYSNNDYTYYRIYYLNTSYVEVKLTKPMKMKSTVLNLNTSYVEVKR